MEIIQMLANLATIVGAPVAIVLFAGEKCKERRDREYGTYDALDQAYVSFMRLCMEHPELDLYDTPLGLEVELTPQQKIQQYAMFDTLISLLERAFLMYRDQSNRVMKAQWSDGWVGYIEDYASRPIFQELWAIRGIDYDRGFMDYLSSLIKTAQHGSKVNSPQQSTAAN
jgi:hypothetical protein